MKTFTDLDCWKEARNLRNQIFELVKSFPVEEKFLLTSQLIRSSRSVTANIAEGHGRFHYQENIQFCRQARGSLEETLDHLTTAQDCKYLINDDFIKLKALHGEVLRLINGYISYLKKRKTETH